MFSLQLTTILSPKHFSLFVSSSLRSGSAVLTSPRQTVCHTSLQTVEETEQLNELYKLLTAKEFQTRMEGLVLLLDYCKSSPQLISTNIVQVCRSSLLLLSR